MGRVVDVNWEELHGVGKEFLDQAIEFREISKELKKDYISVRDAWRGTDANTYLKKSNIIVNKMKKESMYLDAWYEYLTGSAGIYNGNVESGLKGIRAIDSMIDKENKGDVV